MTDPTKLNWLEMDVDIDDDFEPDVPESFSPALTYYAAGLAVSMPKEERGRLRETAEKLPGTLGTDEVEAKRTAFIAHATLTWITPILMWSRPGSDREASDADVAWFPKDSEGRIKEAAARYQASTWTGSPMEEADLCVTNDMAALLTVFCDHLKDRARQTAYHILDAALEIK